MGERTAIYFVADVHLGLMTADPAEREIRFIDFLQKLDKLQTKALYLLGDIWDFWYEYRDVVPRSGAKVVAELINLMNAGVEVWFCSGNHDIWCYSFFESLGMKRFTQPYYVQIDGKNYCLGHGDALGGATWNYKLMLKIFNSRILQKLFSTLHPWFAFRFGDSWSASNRRKHKSYRFRGESEPLYRFAEENSSKQKVDYFVFGHYHDSVDLMLPTGARLIVLKDWIDGSQPHLYVNGASFELRF